MKNLCIRLVNLLFNESSGQRRILAGNAQGLFITVKKVGMFLLGWPYRAFAPVQALLLPPLGRSTSST